MAILKIKNPNTGLFEEVLALKGEPGDAATIAVGTVTTLAPGSAATITNVGTSGAAVFDFGIPKGDTGASSAAEVTVADVGAYYTGTTVEEVLADIGLNYAKKFSPDFSGYPTINGNLIVTSTNGAIDYYVSPAGSNSNNGSSGSPFLTIGYAISKIPKILRHPVTINVAPGAYAENIIIDGFTGIQKISLKGGANSTEALNYIVNRITLENNTVEVYIRGFQSISTSWHPFDVNNCTKFSFYSCVTTAVTTVYNGFNISSSNGYIYDCIAGSKKYALKSYSNSNVFSYSWDSGSTDNEAGLYASEGGTIYYSGAQPSGTTNTAVAFGGIITGAIINPAPTNSPNFTGNVVLPSTTTIGNVSNTEISYLDGVTSGIQSQFNSKAPLESPNFSGTPTVSSNTMWHSGNDGSDSGLDADLLDGINLLNIIPVKSNRDFPNGTTITTSIRYDVTNGDPWILEIKGNSYGRGVPVDIQYQGYIYGDSIINHGGYSVGSGISGLVALNVGGFLTFWFPSQGYWEGYSVRVYTASPDNIMNKVTSITHSAKPSGTKEVALSASIRQALWDTGGQIASLGVGTAASGTAGEIRATNNITAYYSDERLKEFHGKIPNALDKILSLNGYYFTENEKAKELGYTNNKMQVGVSAQEVAAVLPEVVTEAPIGQGYLSVWYEKLVPLLIEAIKEQQLQVEELKKEVRLLRGN